MNIVKRVNFTTIVKKKAMTAKEMKQKIIDQAFMPESGINYPKGSMGWMVRQAKINLLNDFIEQLCREQRENCGESLVKEMGAYVENGTYNHASLFLTVKNAKQPEL